jgi:hypothetical protein
MSILIVLIANILPTNVLLQFLRKPSQYSFERRLQVILRQSDSDDYCLLMNAGRICILKKTKYLGAVSGEDSRFAVRRRYFVLLLGLVLVEPQFSLLGMQRLLYQTCQDIGVVKSLYRTVSRLAKNSILGVLSLFLGHLSASLLQIAT